VPLPFEGFIRRLSPFNKYLRPFASAEPSGSAVSVDPALVISNRMVAESTHSTVNLTGCDSGGCIGIAGAVARASGRVENADATTRAITIATGDAGVGLLRSIAELDTCMLRLADP